MRVPKLPPAKTAPASAQTSGHEMIEDLEEVEDRRSRSKSRKEELDEVLPVEEDRRRRRKEDELEVLDEEEEDRPTRRKRRGDLPDDLPQEADQLGELRTIHEAGKAGPIFGIIICSLLILGGLVMIPMCFVVGHPGPLVFGFLGLVVGPLGILWAVWSMGLKVILFEDGLVRAKRGQVAVIPWEEIEFVWQAVTEHYYNGIHTGTTYEYTVQLYDGTTVKFGNNLKGIEHLGKEILHETSQVLYPKLMARYNKGKVADFGDLGISEEGLYYGDSVLEWDEIDAVQVQGGYISVSKRGKWFNWCNIAASKVPNLWVFMSMVDQIKGIKS